MKRIPKTIWAMVGAMSFCACSGEGVQSERPVELVVLDPGHFHASLLQKNPLVGVADTVHVYAPAGAEVQIYLDAVASYNGRIVNPTEWYEQTYIGDDYLERMLADKHGDVVVLAGNNRKKTDYILAAVKAGCNVLSDKPLAINKADFEKLSEAYRLSREKGTLIYDLMTERYDVLNVVTRALLQDSLLFGEMQIGTADAPAVTMRSVHHFFKTVSGKPLIRPAWYYDVEQQGEGIADVTTHLIDLLFWQCFPEQSVRYRDDVEVLASRHWPTAVSLAEYTQSTDAEAFPPYLTKDVKDGVLQVLSNGSLVYRVNGVHVGMEVVWNYTSLNGGDTFASVMKGDKASLEIVQDESTGFVKQLFIRPAPEVSAVDFETQLQARGVELAKTYPFVSVVKQNDGRYLIDIPEKERPSHEAHFSMVAETFLRYLRDGGVPEWENENTLSKYYITTRAVELARENAD